MLLAGTCHPGSLTRGLSSCPQVLELLCQILQTDSLSAIQFWLLYAPPKGEDTAGAQKEGPGWEPSDIQRTRPSAASTPRKLWAPAVSSPFGGA